MATKNWPGDVCSVYSITNKMSGMQYIGVAKNPEVRFKEHSRSKEKYTSYINRAINTHGQENFEFKVLLVSDRTYCLDMEAKLVDAYGCLAPNGYNLCAGGRGRIQFHKGVNHPQYGKRPPQEAIEKARQFMLGKKLGPLTPEHKDKIGEAVKSQWSDPEQRAKKLAGMQKAHEANKGRKRPLSEEAKQRHIERMKAQWDDPEWRAKVIEARPKPSEESRMKQSEFMKNLWAERKAKEVQSWE